MVMAVVLEDDRDERGAVPHHRHAPLGPAPSPRSSSQGEPGMARVVLIAEDDTSLRQTLTEILELEGHNCVQAEDGETALSILRDAPIDVLVLDLHMPRRDGVSLLEQIDPPPPVVVIHSAFEYYSPQEVERALGTKVFRWLRKPSAPSDLVAAVSAAIDTLPDGA